MDVERANLVSLARIIVREVIRTSLDNQRIVINGDLKANVLSKGACKDPHEATFCRLLNIIEHCLCHGLRKDPCIYDSSSTKQTSGSTPHKDGTFDAKSVLLRAKEQVVSTASNLISVPLNQPNPWPVILHLEQMFPNAPRLSTNVLTMSELRTGLGRSRVWIQQALMCKQLANFFLHLAECPDGVGLASSISSPSSNNGEVNGFRSIKCSGHDGFYHPESLLLNDEGIVFCGLLGGLCSVDFCFVIKDNLKDLDGGLRVLPYNAYLQSMVEKIDRSPNKPKCESAVDAKTVVDQKNYLENINTKLQERLAEARAVNHHLEESLRIALETAEALKLENRGLKITVGQLQKGHTCDFKSTSPVSAFEAQSPCSTAAETVEFDVSLSHKMCELNEKLKKLSLESENRRTLISTLRDELSTAHTENDKLASHHSKLQCTVEQKEMVIKHLEAKKIEMTNIIDQMKERLAAVASQRCACERDASQLRLEVATLETRCSQQQTDIHVQRQMINSLELQLDERVEQLNEFQRCQEQLAEYKQCNVQLSAALDKWRSRCEDQEGSLSEMAVVVSSSKLEADSLRESQSVMFDAHWIDDAGAVKCYHCQAVFSVTRRKHHCRNCGLVFCHACSSKTMQLPSAAKPLRVCDACHSLLMQRYSNKS